MLHPSAIIHPNARVGADCEIGPYCVIGEHVELGERCRLHSHVVIDGHTRLGRENEIFPFASIGLKTQDLKWTSGLTRTEIGDHNTFREYGTVNSATGDGETTIIGSDNHILAYCHIAHNVRLGNHIIMSNVATLAGHIVVEDHAVIGGLAAVHQFCRIGRMAMVGGCSKVVQDVPPFMIADGQSRRNAYDQQGRPGTERRFRRSPSRVAPGVQVSLSRGPDDSECAGKD
jgi:UDP-N-acetylglucosamine acyltransferase